MIPGPTPPRSTRLQRALGWLVVAVVLLAAGVTAVVTARREAAAADQRDEEVADRVAALLEATVRSATSGLKGGDGLADDAGRVSAGDFARFARGVTEGSSLITMGYQRLVGAADRAAFEAEVGRPITSVGDGGLVPAGDHESYLATEHVYPLDGLVRQALGFDLANDPDRGPTVRQALELDATVVAGPVSLAVSERVGMFAVQPVVQDGRVVGTLTAAFLADGLADQAERVLPDAQVAVAAADGSLLDGDPAAFDSGASTTVVVADASFLVAGDHPADATFALPLAIVLGGLALAAGLVVVFHLSARSQQAVERAEQRAASLLELTSALSRAVSTQEVAAALVAQGRALVGADRCLVATTGAEGRALHLLAAEGVAPAEAGSVEGLPVDDEAALARAVAERRTLARTSATGWSPSGQRSPFDATSRAALAIPLVAEGDAIGVVGFAFDRRDPLPDQRSMADAIAAQAGRAMARSRRYDREHEIAEALQRQLLPAALPRLDGYDVAATYRAGAPGTMVGGDWYDAIALGRGRSLVVVGDVVGSGPAAAATMGMLRTTLDTATRLGGDPFDALAALDDVAGRHPEAFSSSCCLVELGPGGELRTSRAGHPPPLVVGPDGARWLEGAASPPLGVGPAHRRAPAPAALAPGESLVLYTDGAVERRGEAIDAGLARLAALARTRHGERAGGLCHHLLDDLLGRGEPTDDVALVVVQRTS